MRGQYMEAVVDAALESVGLNKDAPADLGFCAIARAAIEAAAPLIERSVRATIAADLDKLRRVFLDEGDMHRAAAVIDAGRIARSAVSR